MRNSFVLSLALAAIAFTAPSSASAETYQEYLTRLRDICEVDCLKPRQFRITARKRGSDATNDMAVMMDVVAVRQAGDKFELHNMRVDGNALIEQALLASAGINTSFGSGVGGLSTNRVVGRNPKVVVIEIDKDTLADILNTNALLASKIEPGDQESATQGSIVVEGDAERELLKPTLPNLRSYFRNRRIVVRGQPRLTPVWVGARLDRRRKQVTLQVDDAADIALLPRYENGKPVIVDPLNE